MNFKITNSWQAIVLLLLSATFFGGCSEDEPTGPPPTATFTTSLAGTPGGKITFQGMATDENGIVSIHLSNGDLLLDKTIELPDKPKSYELDYEFEIPLETAIGDYQVTITVKNKFNKSVESIVKVEATAQPPTATFTTPLNGSIGGKITFKGTAADKNGIASIRLSNIGLSLDKTILLSDNPKSYILDYEFEIPSVTALGEYQVAITVKNKFNKSVESLVKVVVANTTNYEALWVGGGVLLKGWNTPEGKFYEMRKDAANPGWFEILLPSRAGFNEIKFLGQNSWKGDNWGVVDNAVANSPILNSENSEPIKLPDLGKKPAYYKVRFNPNKSTYTFEEIIPSGTPPTQMFIVGSGFTGFPNLNWNPSEAIPMTPNPSQLGAWQFLAEGLVFSDNVALKFIGQNTGWSPIDVGFDENYLVDNDLNSGGWQILAPVNWKVTKSGDGTADLKFVNQGGSYTVYFDYFLKRAVIWKE